MFGAALDALVILLQGLLKRASNQRGTVPGYPYPPVLAALKPNLHVVDTSPPTWHFAGDYSLGFLSAALREGVAAVRIATSTRNISFVLKSAGHAGQR